MATSTQTAPSRKLWQGYSPFGAGPADHPRRAGPHVGAALASGPDPGGPGRPLTWTPSLDGPRLTGSHLPIPDDARIRLRLAGLLWLRAGWFMVGGALGV
jgi:hypothetical protein